MTHSERERIERALKERERLKMMNEMKTKEFCLAFKIWCACHYGCVHCEFRKRQDGCNVGYYQKFYRQR